MTSLLIKLFATALALSQAATRPEALKTEFDPVRDQSEVVQILRDGCAHMRKAFDIEDINVDELIATAMQDPQAIAKDVTILNGVNLGDLHSAYRQFCKNETTTTSPIDLAEVIQYYNKAAADLPDHSKLKGHRPPQLSAVLDGRGERFAEIYEPDHRRIWLPIAQIPDHLQKAFIAAEDKRFHQHKGIDERGVIRAFLGNLAKSGRPQGGSTITQQLAKNLLVGDDVTYERKIREMIVASRIERTLSKSEIMELYLNSIYFGRASWGVEMAAQSYFGKSARNLSLHEAALLAGLAKGPNYYDPEKNPDRSRERTAYILDRMREDGAVSAEDARRASAEPPQLAANRRLRRDLGFHFVDLVRREAKARAKIDALTSASYTIQTTINPDLQRATEASLQEGLARYELNTGRFQFHGAEINIAEAVRAIEASTDAPKTGAERPAWAQALERARLPLYDVHWTPAVVIDLGASRKRAGKVMVGLADGRTLPLTTWSASTRSKLQLHDVVRVRIPDGKNAKGARAELRMPPAVQGGVVVLENKSGRILALSGGFSYPLSQFDRATQTRRQPGSTFKPLTYLAALSAGLQPNTMVWDMPITLPPIEGGPNAREKDYWTPQNYDRGAGGLTTLRRGLENSKNMVTARLLDGGVASSPAESLKQVCDLALEAKFYEECDRYYPFVLGSQALRMIDLAAFYAAVANEGARPFPYALETVRQGAAAIYQYEAKPPTRLGSADHVAFYQLKTMLQGVVARGTASKLKALAPFVAGKTGTTENENDAWFVGFTNDITVAVWVGYDNADGRRRTLGRGQTGAKVALPIFEPIVQAAWRHHAPRTALNGPSPQTSRQLAQAPIDLSTGERVAGNRRAFVEHFRTDQGGAAIDTLHRLVPEEEAHAFRYRPPADDPAEESWPGLRDQPGPFAEAPFRRDDGVRSPTFNPFAWGRRPDEDDYRWRPPRRVDPEYPWHQRIY